MSRTIQTAMDHLLLRGPIIHRLCLFILFLFLFLDTLPFTSREGWIAVLESGEGNPLRQKGILLLSALLLGIAFTRRCAHCAIPPRPVLLVFGWALFTLHLSPSLLPSLRAFVVSLLTLIIVRLAIYTYGTRPFFTFLANLIALLAASSLLAAVFIPDAFHLPFDPEPLTVGALRGIFYHKNTAGAAFGIGTILNACLLDDSRHRIRRIALGICLVALLLTRSLNATCLGIGLATMGVLLQRLNIPSLTRRVRNVLAFTLLAILSLQWIGLSSSALLEWPWFHGRTLIWDATWSLVRQSPVWGHGYASLFSVGTETPFGEIVDPQSWIYNVASAHSGYLELAASIGFVGLLLAMAAFAIRPLQQSARIPTDTHTHALCITTLCLLFFALYHNLLESSFLNRAKPAWIALCAACVAAEQLAIGMQSRRKHSTAPEKTH